MDTNSDIFDMKIEELEFMFNECQAETETLQTQLLEQYDQIRPILQIITKIKTQKKMLQDKKQLLDKMILLTLSNCESDDTGSSAKKEVKKKNTTTNAQNTKNFTKIQKNVQNSQNSQNDEKRGRKIQRKIYGTYRSKSAGNSRSLLFENDFLKGQKDEKDGKNTKTRNEKDSSTFSLYSFPSTSDFSLPTTTSSTKPILQRKKSQIPILKKRT